eukprot:scaffold464_cov244-Pinguiococcus_pyrenoidosus.AAC.4
MVMLMLLLALVFLSLPLFTLLPCGLHHRSLRSSACPCPVSASSTSGSCVCGPPSVDRTPASGAIPPLLRATTPAAVAPRGRRHPASRPRGISEAPRHSRCLCHSPAALSAPVIWR